MYEKPCRGWTTNARFCFCLLPLALALISPAVAGTEPSGTRLVAGFAAVPAVPMPLPSPVLDNSADSRESSERTSVPDSDSRPRRAEPETLFLALMVNGQLIEEFAQVLRFTDGRVLVPEQYLSSARLRRPNVSPTRLHGVNFYALDAISAVSYRFNVAEQRLEITTSPDQIETTRIDARQHAPVVPTAASPGIVVNHDVELLRSSGKTLATGVLGANAFGFGGVLSSTVSASSAATSGGFRRLETQFVRELPGRMRGLTLGDSISSGSIWAGQLHFAGVRWSSNYGLQPGFVPFALPGLEGQAAASSTVDIYVNNTRIMSRQVEAGPFAIESIPALTAQGDIRMVVTDTLGRQQVVTQGYVSSNRMLRRGLHDFSYEAGVLRWGIGTDLDTYHSAFASGVHRYGLSDRLTLSLEGQAGAASQTLGGGASLGVLPLGIVSGGAAFSHSEAGVGTFSHFELQHQERRFGLGGNVQFASRSFRRLGIDRNGTGTPRFQAQTQISYSPRSSISTALAYTVQQQYPSSVKSKSAFRGLTGLLGLNVGRLGSLSWTVNYSPTATHQLTGYMTWNIPLKDRRSLTLSTMHNGAGLSGGVDWVQSPPVGDGFGYRARYNSDYSRVEGGMDYQSPYGAYSFEASRNDYGNSFRLREQSGLAWVSNRLVPSRWLDSSFAVVEAPHSKGVSVYANNQYITKTDWRGLAVVPLVPYDNNTVQLSDIDVPLNLELDLEQRKAAPLSRTGVLLTFKAARNQGVLVILQMPDGTPVPLGALFEVVGKQTAGTVAYDGQVFLSQSALPAVLTVHVGEKTCTASVPAPEAGEMIPQVGPIPCTSK